MQTIFQTLRSGNARDRLAVIADITTSVGVSVASIVGGLLALTGTTSLASYEIYAVVTAIIFSLFCLAIAVIIWAGFLILLAYISGLQFKTPHVRSLLYFSLWLVISALTLIASLYYLSMISQFLPSRLLK
jgi:hypothetical protein